MAQENTKDQEIVLEAKTRFKYCEEWEAFSRPLFDYDYKFANGDAHNMYQWDSRIVQTRIADQNGSKPCLTINKVNQHNLMVINDAKQNKPGVNIRPVGDEASFDAAQIFQGIVRHIEYISNAESVYDHATTYQVQAGMGYWRVVTDYISPKSSLQEIYIKRVKDPRSVYLDPDINEVDGSDARYGFIFEDMSKDLYEDKYPDFKDLGWSSTFNQTPDMWIQRHLVRVAEYYRKTQKKEQLVIFNLPDGKQVTEFYSKLPQDIKQFFTELKNREDNLEEKSYYERKVLTDDIQWFKIAGDTIIERGPWLGKYIPIIRLVGTETVIDGVLDRKGHTRALLDPQKIYNWNSSASAEFGALQTKSPWVAATAAIEGYEDVYKVANTTNPSYLPFNHIDDEGNAIPAPTRSQPPQASPAYVEQMKIAQNEMMMVSGQYQAQMGENENAKSGVAINARQRQGDRATYHFIDNNAMAVRYTGKILIDLIPKIYDTKRVIQISATDGSIMNVTVDPEAKDAYSKIPNGPQGPEMDKGQEIANIIFNPNVGMYDVQSEVGPSFATRRQEAFSALMQIAAQNEEFMGIAGDILWKVADFPEAQVLAERWRKIIPKNITGDAVDPKTEEMMHAASDKIEEQLAIIAKLTKEAEDREREFKIKENDVSLRASDTMLDNLRADFDALSKRIVALGNSGPAISLEQIQPLITQAINEALKEGGPAPPGIGQGGTPVPGNEPEVVEPVATE